MASLFDSTPKGFYSSCEVLSALPARVLVDLARGASTLDSTSSQTLLQRIAISLQAESDASSSSGAKTSAPSLSALGGALNALLFIYKAANKAGVSGADLGAKLAPVLSETASKAVAAAWENAKNKKNSSSSTSSSSSSASSAFKLGTVVGFDWKLGMGLCSSNCGALKAPFVSVVWKVADANGVHSLPMELTIAQFQEMHESFQKLDSQLDVV